MTRCDCSKCDDARQRREYSTQVNQAEKSILYTKPNKIKVKKENNYWVVYSACGNFRQQYRSWGQVLRRLSELK